jgi:hypothetical protein
VADEVVVDQFFAPSVDTGEALGGWDSGREVTNPLLIAGIGAVEARCGDLLSRALR